MTQTSTIYRVEVRSTLENSGGHWARLAAQLGLPLEGCEARRLYFLGGALGADQVTQLASRLLSDPVTESFTLEPDAPSGPFIEVSYRPGVTDPQAESLLESVRLLGVPLEHAATGARYVLDGHPSAHDLERLAKEIFSNPVVQHASVNKALPAPFLAGLELGDPRTRIATIHVRGLDNAALETLNKDRRLALDPEEMRAVRDHFTRIDRDPTDAELEMIAQTWSEHCVHKSFKALVRYTDGDETRVVDGLFKTYIRAATEAINKPWVHSAFVDNAGIVAFNDTFDLAFKVETHNHPSALEPFGGANTGVGGVVRDVIGVGARPIANTDVLCFGPLDADFHELPQGALHPQRVMDGVVDGVADYGNKMGIPTVNGAILHHPGYTANPLVFCGCLGLLPRRERVDPVEPEPGDLIVVIGGRTGRDGIGGATFSSLEMDVTTSEIAGSSVQIGHPIHEKQALEAIIQARDAGLYRAITDCGAGGLSSAVGEMAATIGARVDLERVPLKYAGLAPWEIWLSEAQERMVLAVPPQNWDAIQNICDGQDIEAVSIGTFEASGAVHLEYDGVFVGELSNAFLHAGRPQRQLEATAPPKPSLDMITPTLEIVRSSSSPAEAIARLLAAPNTRSQEATIRRYDFEVQGGTAVKPLVGEDNHGPSDAAVVVPGARGTRGAALSVGVCPQYGEIDPYKMAWAAVDEAVRNAVAVGADPDQISILDNFCWGNPKLSDRMGSLVRATEGCYDAAMTYQTPFISGKDSLNNEYVGSDGQRHAIPGTLLISALGIVPDVRKTVTMDFKRDGNLIYVIGDTRLEENGVPQPVQNALEIMRKVHNAIKLGLVRSCHDCSEGGIALAVAEMCIAGRIGASLNLDDVPTTGTLEPETLLFSESLSRFVIEVELTHHVQFERALEGIPFSRIGHVEGRDLVILSRDAEIVRSHVDELEGAWRGF
jgi:phosphoribosylformylglycinamidine synthase II